MHKSKIAAVMLLSVSLTAACVSPWNAGNPAAVVSAPPFTVGGLSGASASRESEVAHPTLQAVVGEAEIAGAADVAKLRLEALSDSVASSRAAQAAEGVPTALDAAEARAAGIPVVGASGAPIPSLAQVTIPAEFVIAQVPLVTSPSVAAMEPAVASAAIRMPIPFRTQKDGDRFQGSNCGPAALGMVLDAFGVARGNSDLRLLSHTYQGTVGARTGTALQHMAHVAADLGLEPRGLYQAPDRSWGKEGFARWTVDDIRAEVLAGRPVVPLVKFRLLPGREDSPVRSDHYIVIHGVDGDEFLYHDPIYESPWEGGARWMSAETLAAAMRPTLVPQQAVSFASGRFAALPVVGR